MESGINTRLERRLQVFTRHRSIAVYLILLSICVASAIPVSIYFYGRVFPWWVDGGNWLKQVNAIFGIEYPMWNEKPLRFDQLYFLSLASLILFLKNQILALKISALLTYTIRPATTFILTRRIFKSELAGLAAAFLSGIHPLFYETLGWGGYPNLLGYAVLPLTFYFILRSIDKTSRSNVLFTGLMVAITAFSHNLTSIVFFATLILWLFLTILARLLSKSFNAKTNLLNVAYSAGILLSILALMLVVTGSPQYNFMNEAAFYKRRITLDDLFWIARNPELGLSSMILTFTSFILVKAIRREGSEPYMLAMASWILTPLLMTQTYLFDISMDYERIFFFSIQPTLIMTIGPLALLGPLAGKIRKAKILHGLRIGQLAHNAARTLPAALLILLSLSFLVAEANIGLSHPAAVNYWYSKEDPYGDREKLEALNWIKSHTPDHAVFVAEEHFARWTEGYASRRVLMYTPPQFLFMSGEVERSMAAETILESMLELRSDLVRISEQEPYGNFTPSVSFKLEGVYEDTLYVNNLEAKLYLTNGTHVWFERFSTTSFKGSYISSGSKAASYKVIHNSTYFSFERRTSLETNYPEVSILYSISTANSNIKPLNFTVPIFSAKGKTFNQVNAESNNSILVKQGALEFHVSMSGQILKAVSTRYNNEDAIILSLAPSPDSSGTITTTISIKADLNAKSSRTVVTIDRDDLIRQFSISYIVIPRNSTVQSGGEIPLELRSLPIYDHLLNDPDLRVVFENSRIIILQVVRQ